MTEPRLPVVIGVPYAGGWLRDAFVRSLMPLAEQCLGVLWEPGPRVGFLRNNLAKRFLQMPEAEWLLYVDADQVFPAETLDRLLRMEGWVNSGLYCARLDAALPIAKIKDAHGVYQPLRSEVVRAGEVVEVDSVGMGCCLVHRRVFETVPFPWSEARYYEADGRWKVLGPDVDFCEKVRASGFKVLVDCGLLVGHIADRVMIPSYEPRVLYEEVSDPVGAALSEQEGVRP